MDRKNSYDEKLQNLESQKQDGLQMLSNAVGGAVNGFAEGSGLG